MTSPLDLLKRRPKMLIQAKIPAELYDQLVRLSEERKTTKSALVLCGLSLLVAELERERQPSKRPK